MADPNAVVDKFQLFIDKTLGQYDELCLAIFGKTREAALASVLAEQVALTMCVTWEGFVSDLIIEHVAASPSTFLSKLSDRINKSVSDRYGMPTGSRVRFSRPTTLNRSSIQKLIDPKGFNLTISSGEGLAIAGNKYLPASRARRFSLPSESIELIDFVKAIRNYLSHKSAGARAELKTIVDGIDPTGKNGDLAGDLLQVGPYLKNADTGERRSAFIGRRLREISEDLR